MASIVPVLPHDFPDRVIRDALRQPANLRELCARILPEVTPHLDFSRMFEIPRTFLLDDYRERESDLLVEVPFVTGSDTLPLLICLLIEHQSTISDAIWLRLLVFAALYWDQQLRAWKSAHPRGQRLRLTPVLPVVLFTGADPWDGSRSLADLFSGGELFRPYVPQWQGTLCDLTTFNADELAHSPEAFWNALAVVRGERAPGPEYLRIIEDVSRHLAALAEQERPRWDQLLKMVLYWSIYRRSRGEHPDLVTRVRGSQASALFQLEVQKMAEQMTMNWETEIAVTAVRARDMEYTNDQRTLLLKLLQKRFSTISPAVCKQIDNAGLDKLKVALEQIFDIHAPEELQF